MRFLSYLMVIVFLEYGCAHEVNRIINHSDTPALSENVEFKPEADEIYVPKIKFSESVTVDSIQKTMTQIKKVTADGAKGIVIEINSPGGIIDEGFKLSKQIEESPIPIICVVDVEAASMGMYILQSCHYRMMTKRSRLMIHEAAIDANVHGYEYTYQTYVNNLRAYNVGMAEHLAKRMNVSAEDLLKRMVGGLQWWLSWKEATSVNAVDCVVDSVDQVTDFYRESSGKLSCYLPR